MSDYSSEPETNLASGPPHRLKERYRLVEWLGEGAMGAVYRALDETLGREVAIKFLARRQIANPEASTRFLREARVVASLTHPNIMALYDVDREGEWHYLVLEYIRGQNLHRVIQNQAGPLPLAEALRIISEVLQALAYAHAQGVIHRDIKPENMMLTPDGHVKVTDFGLSLARGEVRLTQEDTIIGTLLYLAPEVAEGAPADSRADLYAVGAVLYELLAGCPPFNGDNLTAIFAKIVNAQLTPPRVLNPGITAEVEGVVLKLLARNPAERYSSATEALAALPVVDHALLPAVRTGLSLPTRESLLERLVRKSSGAQQTQPVAATGSPQPAGDALALADSLLLYAALEDTSLALETERRRLARLLQDELLEPLNLLLAQAQTYQQTLAANAAARMAVSVLTSLVRQVIQQARDLEANLYPTVLENLGLEPALEALANQINRAQGLQISLEMERLPRRLPTQIELALFRAAQEALEQAVHYAHASRVQIALRYQDEQIILSLTDNGTTSGSDNSPLASQRRIEQLGGKLEIGPAKPTGRQLTIRFTLAASVQLTPREKEVIELLVEGLSNKEIGEILFITPRTVNYHLDNIYAKLGVNSRTEAAIYALRQGWQRKPV